MDTNETEEGYENGKVSEEAIAWLSGHFGQMPMPVEAVAETLSPNTPVILHEGPLQLFVNGIRCASGIGSIALHWLPTPSLWYTVNLDPDHREVFRSLVSNRFELGVRFDDFPNTTEATIISGVVSFNFLGPEFSHRFKQGFTHNVGTDMTRTVFHVANCVPFFGTPVGSFGRSEEGFNAWSVNGRCQFIVEGWSITLDRTPQADNLTKAMDEEPGYAITHVGEITRLDGSSFSASDISILLENLAYFLSFCSGRWCGPMLVYGFNTDGQKVWVDWRVGRLDLWKG